MQWFEDHGDIDRALAHATLTGDPALGMAVLEKGGGWRLIYRSFRGGGPLFRAIAETAAGIDLPAFPLTTLGLAIFQAKAGQIRAAGHYLRIVETTADPANIGPARQIRVVRALLSLYSDRTLSLADLSELKADLTAERDFGEVHRGLVLNLLSYNYLARTELERAIVYGELAFRCLQDSGAFFGAMHQHIHVGQAAFFAGNTVLAEETYARVITDAQTHMGPGCDLDAIGQVLMAELRIHRGEWAEGTRALDWALAHVDRHDAWFDIFAAGFLSRQSVALIHGDLNGAQAAISEARRWAQRRGFERLRRLVEGGQARLLLAAGSPAEAGAWATKSGLSQDGVSPRPTTDLLFGLRGSVPAMFWVRFWLASGHPGRARTALNALLTVKPHRLHVPQRIEVDLLNLRVMLAEGRIDPAAALLSALVLEVPVEDFRATFLIEAPKLMADLRAVAGAAGTAGLVMARLDAIAAGPTVLVPTVADHSADPAQSDLTQRDQSVLHLIAAGNTNKQVCQQLALTENTVKFHLRNIFAKLAVNTRTGAISAARQLGILG